MKKILFAAIAILAIGFSTSSVSAAVGCASPFCGNSAPVTKLFAKSPMPTLQAAPWYLYWPYNAHFQTPAPLGGPFMAPPGIGGAVMMNPYFPTYPGR